VFAFSPVLLLGGVDGLRLALDRPVCQERLETS
jgi:hypothetical protein